LVRLQQTNRRLSFVAAASCQWHKAAEALETEFPPPGEDPEEPEFNEWRIAYDPRASYSHQKWRALPPHRRFAKMIPLCHALVADLQTAAEIVGAREFRGFGFEPYPGEDENSRQHQRTMANFFKSGHTKDVGVLTALSFFECELRNAKSTGAGLAYDVEGMLVDDSYFPGGSSGRDAIAQMYYPPLYAGDGGSFDVLPGSVEHVEMLLHPALPFTAVERQLLGTELVESMRIKLEAPWWHPDPRLEYDTGSAEYDDNHL
jgi:hypothetical protein